MAVTVTNASGVTTVTLSAAGDTASPQDIIAAGFGVAEGRLAMSSAHTIVLKIATGATYDETGWTIILASTRYVQLDCSYGGGTWLKGYRLGQKVQGGTYMSQGAWGAGGGINIITGTATPGNEPLIRWHNVRLDSGTSSNRQPVFLIGDNAILDIDGLVLANQDQGGANSSLEFNLGKVNNLAFVRANCEIGGEGAIDGLSGTGIFSTELRLSPRTQNYRVRGFTPAEEAFTELWFRSDLVPDVTTLFYFLDDPNMEENFDWPNRIRKYNRPAVLDVTRRLQILIRDAAGTPVSNTRIYNVSDGNVLYNVLAAGDFDEQSVFWRGTWTSSVNSYIYPNISRYTDVQTVNVRKYGYIYEQLEFNLREQAATQPLFLREIPFILSESAVDALTGISLDHENKIATIAANANVVDLFSWYLRQLETESHADKPLEWDATVSSIDLGEWDLVIDAANFTGNITTTGTVTLQNGATVAGSVVDANGVLFEVSGLDPQSLGTTWTLGYMTEADYQARDPNAAPATWVGWNQINGTGNTAQVQLAADTAYRLFHRAPGYDNTTEATVDTGEEFSTVLTPIADRDLQGSLLWPQTAAHIAQAAKFTYNATEGLVDYDNQTGSTDYIPFLAGYRAFGNIVYSPALTFSLRFLPRVNATKDGFVLDPDATLTLRMSDASDASAILEADLAYTNGQKAYDRFVANTNHLFLLYAQMSEVLSSSSVQQVASAVDQSTILAKEATVATRASQTSVDAIPTNPLLADAYTAPDNANIAAIKAKTDNLPALKAVADAVKAQTDKLVFTGDNLHTVAKLVEDKAGYALTTADKEAIAAAVEQAILDDQDGSAILEAIVGAIGNQNIDQIALVAAIRADIERAGGMLDAVPTLVEIEASTVLAKEATVATRASQVSVDAIPTNPVLATDARLDNLDAAVSSRLATGAYTAPPTSTANAQAVRDNLTTELGRLDAAVSSRLAADAYTAPDNAGVAAIKAKTDNLPSDPASTSDVSVVNEGVKKASLMIPHDTDL